MNAKKTHWLRTTIIILLVCCIAGLALTAKLFFDNPPPTYAQATVEFTFEGAADGIAPNNSAFSIADIANEGVLSAALEKAGMQNDYTVEQLRQSLVARGVYPDDMAELVMNYDSLLNFNANREMTTTSLHPTTFDIALYNDFDRGISKAKLVELMKAIMEAYKEHFARVHANGLQKENMLFDVSGYDYPQQLEIIRTHFTTLSNYAQEMSDRHPTFQREGVGFNDISVRLNTLINSDITRLNADLTLKVLTRDAARLQAQYQFEILDLSNKLERQTAQLKKLDKLIDAYNKDEVIYVSAEGTLTKIDSNSSETYDNLVDRRREVSNSITEIKSNINDYQLKLSDLTKDEEEPGLFDAFTGGDDATALANASEVESEPLTKVQAAALEKGIAALIEKGDAIIDDFQLMLQAFNEQEINDLTVAVTKYDYEAPTVLSGAFIKKAVMTAGPICAIGFMLCLALIIASRRREEKLG